MKSYFRLFRCYFTISILGVASLHMTACAQSAPEQTPEQIGSSDAPFATTLSGEPVHEEVTAAGLSFLKPDIVLQLQFVNLITDILFFFDSRYHFDDCNFPAASEAVAFEQSMAVNSLDPSRDTQETTQLALTGFARSLHTVQDFYAHTNWVESGATDLVDGSLGEWPTLESYSLLTPSNLVVVSGTPPQGTRVARDSTAPYPEDALVSVRRGSMRRLGLISGNVDYEPGEQCPARVAMLHDELNKDRSTTPERAMQHEQAKALATRQTTHEWCRLVALTRARWGEAGEQRLNGWLAPGATPPDCSP